MSIYSGLFDFDWPHHLLAVLVLTHITIASVTVYLHRHQAHRALELAPSASHFFRFWLWLTTGMITREWAAVHRKHHARCETADDPHSPQQVGLARVLFAGAWLYRKEAQNKETIQRYGRGTPDDWIERNLYSRFNYVGVLVMLAIDLVFFGLLPGGVIWAVQMIWIPFWAAGMINGVGHYWGYRNYECSDAATNICPWGILVGGEELHNNHHSFATSAKLSSKWFEFDIGWFYIRCLAFLGLAQIKHVAARPKIGALRTEVDAETLDAVIAYRYDLMARFARSLKQVYREELNKLRHPSRFSGLKRWLAVDAQKLPNELRGRLDALLAQSHSLATLYRMRDDLVAVWSRSHATREQLVRDLQDWCRRAETSGIRPLQDLSFRVRSYVPT